MSKPEADLHVQRTTKDCRFYQKLLPEVDDVVMVIVRRVNNMCCFVGLLEYNGMEGMILLSELSRKRIRSIHKFVKVGKIEAVQVVRVDAEKGYLDLSKKRVTPAEAEACLNHYNMAHQVHSFIRYVSMACTPDNKDVDVEKYASRISWPMFAAGEKPLNRFRLAAAQNNISVFDDLDLDDEEKEMFMKVCLRRMYPQPIKIQCKLELQCVGYEGIEAVKTALAQGETVSTEGMKVTVQTLAPPLYFINTTTLDKNKGIAKLEEAIELIRASIETFDGGSMSEVSKPTIIGDDSTLAQKVTEEEESESYYEESDSQEEEEVEGMGNIDMDV